MTTTSDLAMPKGSTFTPGSISGNIKGMYTTVTTVNSTMSAAVQA